VTPSRRGLALVVVTAVLGVLAVLATGFVTLARIERRASQQRLNATKAFLLARSGIEDALACLQMGQDPIAYGAASRGDLEEGSGALTYSLKVEDESGKINVNGGFLDAADRDNNGLGDGVPDCRDPDVRLTAAASDNGLGWNFQLCRILNLLGHEPELGMSDLGTRIFNLRPPGGYESVAHLQSLIGGTTDLSPYLTTSSWIDHKVVQPNGWAAPARQNAMNEIKKQRAPLELAPAGRPPVNLNTAPRAVLRALMREILGYATTRRYDIPVAVELSPSGNPSVVDAFADQMLARRASMPFRDWSDFSGFCDTLPALVIPVAGLSPSYINSRFYLADLIKANFDPNTALNKDLPDQLKFRFLDKSDLKVWSTEGCFEPTGVFRISALGRVLSPEGKLLAGRSLSVMARHYDLLRQTTQRDFLAGRPLEQCHSLSTLGGILRTTGADASWPGWRGSGQGLSTLSYPNPPTVSPADAAEFDGYLGLATVETDPGEGALRFLHHLDDGWTADIGVAPNRFTPASSDSMLPLTLTESVWPASGEPNTLRPDGLHIQSDRCPAFLATNMPPATASGSNRYNHGVIGLWVKPSPYPRSFDFSSVKGNGGSADTQVLLIGRTSVEWGIVLECRMVLDTDGTTPGPEREAHLNTSDIPMQHPMLRWALETALFDTEETVTGQDLRFDLRTFDRVVTRDPNMHYARFDTTASSDLFAWDIAPGTPAQIVLGCPATGRTSPKTSFSHAVIDEVCICDFGDDGHAAAGRMDAWAAERFRDGRYYKENDASFLSAPLTPGAGTSRLLWSRWTAYLPKEIRKEGTDWNLEAPAADRPLDPHLLASSVELDLLDKSGDFSSTRGGGGYVQPLTSGDIIGKTLGSFRYRVTFKPNLDDLSYPVLESPFLDDITFAWQAATGPRILGWGEP